MVERQLAKLVDNNSGFRQCGVFQHPIEQCGLSGAQEAGQHCKRNRRRRDFSLGVRRSFAHCVVELTFGLTVFAVFAGLAVLVVLPESLVFFAFPESLAFVAFFFGFFAFVAFFFDSSVLAATCFFFFGVALAVCSTVSGRSAGPVKTTTGGTVSTGGPSTNFAGFTLDSITACWPLPDSSLAAAVDSSGSSSFSSDGGLRRCPPHISSRRF